MVHFDWGRGRKVLPLLWLLLPLLATMLWLFLLMGVLILPNLLTLFVSPESAAWQLLKICQLWYLALVLALLSGFPIICLAGRFACRRLEDAPGRGNISGIVLACLIFPCIFTFGMVFKEDLPSKFLQAGADLSQIEADFLVDVEVWISPKARPARLPGPYSEPLTEPVTRYGIISGGTGCKWVQIYVPNAMGFSLDQDRLYDENQSIQWNWDHARRYRVRYTSNFHLAAEIAPVE